MEICISVCLMSHSEPLKGQGRGANWQWGLWTMSLKTDGDGPGGGCPQAGGHWGILEDTGLGQDVLESEWDLGRGQEGQPGASASSEPCSPPCPPPPSATLPYASGSSKAQNSEGGRKCCLRPLSTKGPAWELLSVRRPRAHTPLAAQCLDSGRWTPDGTRIGGHQPGLDLALSQARKLTVSPGLPRTPRVVPGLEPPGLQSGLSGWEARADGGDQ